MTDPSIKNEFWDERFQHETYAYGKDPNDFLRAHAPLFKAGTSILSLAEGEGRNITFLAQQGCNVRGVDFSQKGHDKAMRLAKTAGVSIDYDLADLNDYDMGQHQWDGVISIFCHPNEAERAPLFQKIQYSLKPGGIFLLEAYHQRQPDYATGGPRERTHLFTLEELKIAFSDYEILHAHEGERDVHEGTYHTGTSYTVQFIARKPIK